MKGKTGANEEKKEAYVLIKVKPKYVEEFCIRMVACRGLCNRISKSKNLGEIDEVFSVLGPYDFLLELSGVGASDEEKNKKINRTIFKIRETLGNYIDETCTLTQFELSEFLEEDDEFLLSWDNDILEKDKESLLGKDKEILLKNKFDIIGAKKMKLKDDETIDIVGDEKELAKITIDTKKDTATLKINDNKTYGLKVKKNDKQNILYSYSSKELFEKAKSLETKEKEDGELNDFRNFLEKEGTFFDILVNLQEDLDCGTEIENLWKKNTCLFRLKPNCKKYLKDGSVGVELKKEIDGKLKKKHRRECESPRRLCVLCALRKSPQLIEHVLKKKFDGKKQCLSDKAKVYEIDAKYLFNWDKFTENDERLLISYLRDDLKVSWAKNGVEIKSEHDGDKTIRIYESGNSAEMKIDKKKGNVTLKIDNARVHYLKVKHENGEVNVYDVKNWKIVDDMNRYGIYDTGKELNVYKIMTKDVHVLIKVKPAYTEEFFVAMNIFKSLCNRASSQSLAAIDKVCSMLGPYDFLLELSGVGDNAEDKDKTIKNTILKIRETLGGYINETLTIEKFKIPMKKEELEKLFEKILEEKTLAKLPGIDGEKIPDEGYKSDEEIDLEDIYNAETTSLKNLLKRSKTFLELEYLTERIDDLDNRVGKLEKKVR